MLMTVDIVVFQSANLLPAHFKPASREVSKLSSQFVLIENDKREFHWRLFSNTINQYQASELTQSKFKSAKIKRGDATVEVMSSRVIDFFTSVLSVRVDDEMEKNIYGTIRETFSDLQGQRTKNFASFSNSSVGNNVSWEYRLLYAVAMSDCDDYFYAIVMTVRVEANVEDRESWWGLVHSSSKDFSATIDTMELEVAKNFKYQPELNMVIVSFYLYGLDTC